MLHFDSDYMEGAHPAIIERLAATNLDQTSGYGTDEVCESARDRIRTACMAPEAAVYFLVGGTQANIVALDQLLNPWEGVVAANTGHINGHEAGAPEEPQVAQQEEHAEHEAALFDDDGEDVVAECERQACVLA